MPIRPRWISGRRWLHAGIAAVVIVVGLVASAVASNLPPLTQQSFDPSPPQGFGDRQNSWAWAMGYFNNHVIVGTNRAYRCISDWELTQSLGGMYVYPPPDPDMSCTASPADLSLQAEIWSLDPTTNIWSRVYQSPNNIPNPQFPGRFVPPDVGYRTMSAYTESDGTQSLYVGGVSSAPMWTGPVPPPRILRTTDAINWTPIPQDPGTFMGTLPQASFRGMTAYNGQLFVVNGTVDGQGVIIASSNPSAGDNAWTQVSPAGLQFYDMAVFNGWLYAGTYDVANGYSVYKTQATGTPPYNWIPVVTNGAGVTPAPSGIVVSMTVSNGRLYVGTAFPAEMIRLNPDDTWDLIEGTPRNYTGPGNPLNIGMHFPISGLGNGFENEFNVHIWRMIDFNNVLYAGTYDSSIIWKNVHTVAGHLKHLLGMDLYGTSDGWYWSTLTLNGFGNEFDFGVRNFAATPYGLFLGTANDYYGLNVFRAVLSPNEPPKWELGPGSQGDQVTGSIDRPVSRTPAPVQLQIELNHNQPVLTWAPVLGEVRYHVLRAPINTVALPTQPPPPGGSGNPYGDTSVSLGLGQPLSDSFAPTAEGSAPGSFDSNGKPAASANPYAAGSGGLSYTFPGNFVDVGSTNDTVFVDQPLTSTVYAYMVATTDLQGQTSNTSNMVQAPSITPTMTYSSAQSSVQLLNQRNLFVSAAAYNQTVQALQTSQSQASSGDYAGSEDTLKGLVQQIVAGNVVPAPDSTDLTIIVQRMALRVKLANSGFVDPSSLN
jgi:hypothetical protein